MTAEKIAHALNGRKSGIGWVAQCPAHEDRHPSLSITQAGRKVLIHCFGGCRYEDVIKMLTQMGIWKSVRYSAYGDKYDYGDEAPKNLRRRGIPDL